MKIPSPLIISLFLFTLYTILLGILYLKISPNSNLEKQQQQNEREKEGEKEEKEKEKKDFNPWCGDTLNIQQPENPYKKIISFVAYQQDPTAPLEKWIEMGVLDNSVGRDAYFPDWVTRAYIIHPSPELETLLIENNWEIIYCVKPKRMHFSMLYRFFAYDEDIWLFTSRDLDSRLSPRELFVINEWIASDYLFHTIRDHPKGHSIPILGGMFGMRKGAINGSMVDLIQKALNENDPITGSHGEDQSFLQRYVWPQVAENALEHDSHGKCFGGKECRKFPQISGQWGNDNFIGNPFKIENHINSVCNMTCKYE